MRALTFIRTVGSGAFGTVYLAELSSGQGFRRQVAVKVLHRRPADDSTQLLARIRDEARLLGLLQDDAILKVLDMVRVEQLDAVMMEYVEGADLDSLSEAGGRPPPRALAEIGSGVAGGLHRAHIARHPTTGEELRVIHRDVKPANVMVTTSGTVKLLDFGVARARFDARESSTGQLMLGTLNYMAPEYIITGEVSPAADVYGLAVTLWQAAAGESFGQPKVRQDGHERRVEQRLEQIAQSHGPMVPILAEMLRWSPGARPTAGDCEALLQDAADQMAGQGLKAWARQAVAEHMRRRGEAEDKLGLLGRTIAIQSEGAENAEDPQRTSAPQPAPLPQVAPRPIPQTASPAAPARPPAPAPPPARPPAPQPPAPQPPLGPPLPTRPTAAPAPTPIQRPPEPSAPVRPRTPAPQAPAPQAPAPQPVPPPAPELAAGPPSIVPIIIKGLLGGMFFGMLVVAAGLAFLLTR
jgi:serine/threonine protein kinase